MGIGSRVGGVVFSLGPLPFAFAQPDLGLDESASPTERRLRTRPLRWLEPAAFVVQISVRAVARLGAQRLREIP